MIAQKWNPFTSEYHPYCLPKGTILVTHDMEEISPCSNCGEDNEFGNMFTSKTIHTRFGFGYPVCGKCYEKEWDQEELASKQSKEDTNQ